MVLTRALTLLLAGPVCLAQSPWHTLHNDFYWVDQNGQRILTRSGCLCKFDGVYYWYGGTQWTSVDLEKPTEINRVILKWNTNAAKEFKVQTSTDATNWTDVFSTNLGASYTVTDETFKTTTARYVRMTAAQKAPIPTVRADRVRRGQMETLPAGYSLFDFMVRK